jgi:uroporphyrinogen III methyltransferase/synthase
VGTRSSTLALIQTRGVVAVLRSILPECFFEIVSQSSPGDRDQQTDLRQSPGDFFTRDLDDAVRRGDLDCAVHSAKDLPDPVPEGIDWCWLPGPADRRDALILRRGESVEDLPARFSIGVSSERREAYCRTRFPQADMRPIRGNIGVRLEQLDRGDVDVLVMAGCALLRLGLEERITEWIPLCDLPTPPGQGSLALTFRADDDRFLAIRSLFVRSVTFAGAGAGSVQNATLATIEALKSCDVCLHDALLDPALLEYVRPEADIVDVGKRCEKHRRSQQQITELIARDARRGLRVVRLKGGDPGIFGRLAEETEALDRLRIPYRVLPGISSLNAATTSTGMLLTRRGTSTGFCVMTPRKSGGGRAAVSGQARADLPIVLFMSVKVAGDVADELIADGLPRATPAAVVFDAGSAQERIVPAPLCDIGDASASADAGGPGLLIIGEPAEALYPRWGPLAGKRVLLTCSDTLAPEAAQAVLDAGGTPIQFPLIRLRPADNAETLLQDVGEYDWIILSSPSAVRIVAALARRGAFDLRSLPRILVAGTRTADELRALGITADAVPDSHFGADGIVETAQRRIPAGSRLLRLRSDKAGDALADRLRALGLEVRDEVVYVNETIDPGPLPAAEAVFFASTSAVECFLAAYGVNALDGRLVAAIGTPTARALECAGRGPDIVPDVQTAQAAIHAMAVHAIQNRTERQSCLRPQPSDSDG